MKNKMKTKTKMKIKNEFSFFSVVSRAILKPVYRFGIPNSDPQTLKSVKINSSKNRQMTVHAMF